MATPPLPDAPFGKIMIGSTLPNHVNQKPYWVGQGIQPVVDIETEWLTVGHVDEIFMWVATNKVLYADPWLAADLLHEQISTGNGTNSLWFGITPSGTNATVQSAVVAQSGAGYKITTLPAPGLPDSTNAVNIVFAEPPFATNDILRVNSELLKVTAANGSTVTVARAQAGRPAVSHAEGSVIYAYSQVIASNFHLGATPDATPWAKIQIATNQLSVALGDYATSVDFIPMPVLFMYVTDIPHWTQTRAGYVAATANVVNGLLGANGAYHYSQTGNAAFEQYVSSIMPQAAPHNLWYYFHRFGGGMHCATAARRDLPATPPWWSVLNNWE